MLAEVTERAERDAIIAFLTVCRGNRKEAAAALRVSVRTLQRRLDALDLRERLAALAAEHGWPTPRDRMRAISKLPRPGRRKKSAEATDVSDG
jgi:hypothetical protein